MSTELVTFKDTQPLQCVRRAVAAPVAPALPCLAGSLTRAAPLPLLLRRREAMRVMVDARVSGAPVLNAAGKLVRAAELPCQRMR
jgi:hypothetical protein